METSDSDAENIIERYIKSNTDLSSIGWADIPLRVYQLAGVNWLIDCYKKEHGAILGDEMGLGKTCQTIAFILYTQRSKKKTPPSLVVCPRSVLENWEAEIKRFAPTLKVLCYVGDKDKRNQMAQDIKNKSRSINVLVTTYELCLKDSGFLSSMNWACLVVDEAHRLKNSESILHQTLREWDIPHSVLLTGTPVQNNLQELYALLSFIAPKKFRRSGKDKFVEKFNDADQSNGLKELHSLLKPYLLRRTKEEVLKDLPKKSEIVMFHGISKLQKKLYKAILTKDISAFETTNYRGETSGPSLMNILMQLRKCVNHPYLFDGVEPEPFMIGDHLVEASGKLVVLDKMLSYLKSAGHKVLLFSQMTHMLDVLQDYLGYRDYSYERLDGSVRGEERFIAVQNFNKNEDTFVFLLSTKAGGQGLNLVAADTVIFIDSDFNPQNDLQAAARAHRIGQTRPVKIVRLVGRNTVEEIILKRAEEKLKLTEKVIEEGEFSLGVSKQKLFTDDKVKLTDILKFGVDDLLKDDDSSDTDIDFTKMLGPSVNGEWQVEEEVQEKEEEAEGSDVKMVEEGHQSMYVFEGTDYSKEPSSADQKAFDELIEAARVVIEEDLGERSLRKKTSLLMGPLGEVARKPRKTLTPEEIEERKQKRKEAAEKRAKLAEEQEIRRAQEKRKKKEELWKANGYTSARVEIPSDDEDEDIDSSQIDFDQEDDEGKPKSRAIHYISGDVMKPVDSGSTVNLIIHCADDSGGWGKGGLFTAISKRSEVPEKQYDLAGKLLDLALGDCHLIPIHEDPDEVEHEDWLALIIAQHRDKRNHLSGIKLPALREGLECVHYAAKARGASVHLPRIGHDTPGFNWYGTERLIKKHLASKGIPTYIYYYPRKHNLLKRKTTYADTDKTGKKTKQSPDQSSNATVKSTPGLLDLFSDLSMYIHPDKFTADQLKIYRRYFIAYDGDVDAVVSKSTKIILIHSDVSQQDLKAADIDVSDQKIVTNKWLEQCLMERTCLSTIEYEV